MAFGIFDAHCDTITTLQAEDNLYDAPRNFNLKQLENYDYFTQVMAIWVDIAKDGDSLWDNLQKHIARFYLELEKNPSVKLLKTKNDILESKKGTNLILGIEGGEAVGKDIANVEKLYNQGVRLITLTWNNPYAISDTNCITVECLNGEKDYKGGLTKFGKEVVKEMNRLGMMIDVSHLSDKGFYDLLETSSKPFIASHSNSRNLCNHPRNLTDDMFKELIKIGGVAGINFYHAFLTTEKAEADMTDIVRHIEHFMSLGGEKNVGIGTDFDGIDYLPKGFRGACDLGTIYEALLKLNYNEDIVRDIMCGNMERVFAECL